jgi:hypothetical protein
MPTKADFYLGINEDASWIGSVFYDGEPTAVNLNILIQINPITYEEYVIDFILKRMPGSASPHHGEMWPWIWPDSRGTDYAYMFDYERNIVVASWCGGIYFNPLKFVQGEDMDDSTIHDMGYPRFPNMKGVPISDL